MFPIFSPVHNCEVFYPVYFSILAIAAVLILRRFLHERSKYVGIAYAFVLLGAIANLLERMFTGCVWDYINFFGLFSFNLFDLMVTSGIFLLIYRVWVKKN